MKPGSKAEGPSASKASWMLVTELGFLTSVSPPTRRLRVSQASAIVDLMLCRTI
jgi:hypothetical protein